MENKKYLYHYTSIETLLLILKNKTLCFNSLINVDDLEESETEDIKKLGRFCYVSCWTDSSEELIPLWNMYTPNMQGIRIKLEEYPFMKYYYKKNEYNFKEDSWSYIDYNQLERDGKASIVPQCPIIKKVIYTEDQTLLFPKVKKITNEIKKEVDGEITSSQCISYNIKEIGAYKRENWRFQNEVRYIIPMSPWSMKELELCGKHEKFEDCVLAQRKLIERLEDETLRAPYDRYFLKLNDEALKNIEILLGPKVTEAQEEIVDMIVKKYCPTAKVSKSSLKIR